VTIVNWFIKQYKKFQQLNAAKYGCGSCCNAVPLDYHNRENG
jgi:hypothetical protein